MPKIFLILTLFLIYQGSYATDRKEHNEEEWVEKKLSSMNLEEKIGQLFMIAVYSNRDSEYENDIEKIIRKNNIGGVIFFQGDPVRQVNLTNRLQKVAKYPLMVGMDAEHGIGWRLQSSMIFPKMIINGAITNDSLIFELGATIARHCKELGVHVNFAPVTDINNNPSNPVIGNRSFGENRDNVFYKNLMYIRGSLSENVMPVAKHFPGHGDTETDSHKSMPVINHSLAHLDSIELYPYKKLIEENIPYIMAAHLNVYALDPANIPASLSPRIVKYWLREHMQFDGLCFTDALNMKGVSSNNLPGETEVKAFLAGNDILLFPENVEAAVDAIKKAVKNGRIEEEDIHNRCRKILQAKYQFVIPNIGKISTDSLWSKLHRPEDFALKHELYKNAITLIKNKNNLLPLKRIDTLKIASINFGSDNISHFQTTLGKYARIQHFSLKDTLSEDSINEFIQKLSPYNCIIIYNSTASDRASRQFGYSKNLIKLIREIKDKKIIFCHPGIPYGLADYVNLPVDAILLNYEDYIYAAQYAGQAVFGGIPVRGKLPVTITPLYPEGFGLNTEKTRLGYALPEMCGIPSGKFNKIDSLCNAAIATEAAPGCQVLIAKNNYIIYNKVFGHTTYQKTKANHPSNIYDIASITKIAATIPAIMKLYDEGEIKLDTPLSVYYPPLQQTDKKEITVREVLAHQSGLKNYIAFFIQFIDAEKLDGKLFSSKPTKTNVLRVSPKLYVNPNIQFKENTISFTEKPDFIPVMPGVYAHKSVQDSILNTILSSELNPKKDYLYSDLGFILLQKAIETITGESLDQFCKENFYNKLGAYHTDFIAAERLNNELIVPSSYDNIYRKKELKGYVHDPSAFLLGGVSGHAGLFSSAEDLAKIMAVYLNEGYYGGESFISPSTIDLFGCQTNIYEANRRGLGFDKPEIDSNKVSPTCPAATSNSFGHSGFTGTIAWCDPDHQLIYIFLSNRTYPSEFNTKLIDENIRTKVQAVIYEAME